MFTDWIETGALASSSLLFSVLCSIRKTFTLWFYTWCQHIVSASGSNWIWLTLLLRVVVDRNTYLGTYFDGAYFKVLFQATPESQFMTGLEPDIHCKPHALAKLLFFFVPNKFEQYHFICLFASSVISFARLLCDHVHFYNKYNYNREQRRYAKWTAECSNPKSHFATKKDSIGKRFDVTWYLWHTQRVCMRYTHSKLTQNDRTHKQQQ